MRLKSVPAISETNKTADEIIDVNNLVDLDDIDDSDEFYPGLSETTGVQTLSSWTAEDFSRIYVSFRPQLERHARKFLQSQTQVDDVVQDAFLYLLVTLPQLDSELGVLRFLKWKVRLLALDVIRANGRVSLVPIEEHPNASIDDRDVSTDLEQLEDAAIVKLALSKLNEKHRSALIMNVYQDKSIQEISKAFKLSPNATSQLLFRARAAFKVALVGDVDTTGMSNAQVLSVAVRKAAEATKKNATRAVALLLVLVGAVSGYQALTGKPAPESNQAVEKPQLPVVVDPVSPNNNTPVVVDPTAEPKSEANSTGTNNAVAKKSGSSTSNALNLTAALTPEVSLARFATNLKSVDNLSYGVIDSAYPEAKVYAFESDVTFKGTFVFNAETGAKISDLRAVLYTSEGAVDVAAGLSTSNLTKLADGSTQITYLGTITELEDSRLKLRSVTVTAIVNDNFDGTKSLTRLSIAFN